MVQEKTEASHRFGSIEVGARAVIQVEVGTREVRLEDSRSRPTLSSHMSKNVKIFRAIVFGYIL